MRNDPQGGQRHSGPNLLWRVHRGIHVFQEKRECHCQEKAKDHGGEQISRRLRRGRTRRHLGALHDLDIRRRKIIGHTGLIHSLQHVVVESAIDHDLLIQNGIIDADFFKVEGGVLLLLGLGFQRLLTVAGGGII